MQRIELNGGFYYREQKANSHNSGKNILKQSLLLLFSNSILYFISYLKVLK